MKKFAFVNNAAEKEYRDLPKTVQSEFGVSLRAIQDNKKPFLPILALKSIGAGVIELKINGSPAFRCAYVAKYKTPLLFFTLLKKPLMAPINKPCEPQHYAIKN